MTSLRTDDARRRHDLAFLATIRTAGALELLAMRRALAANGPDWKRVAVYRALARLAREGRS